MQKSSTKFNEIFVIMDDQSWIWQMVAKQCERGGHEYVRLPSDVPIRHSWTRFSGALKIVVHWEAAQRSGGAIIEEILDVERSFNAHDRIIVVTTNPTREDVVHLSELGVGRIVKARNRSKELEVAGRELALHLSEKPGGDAAEEAWRRTLYALDNLPDQPDPALIKKISAALDRLRPTPESARSLDADGMIAYHTGRSEEALRFWNDALGKNPNYYRTYHNLIRFYRQAGQDDQALALMQKMQELNRNHIGRLVGMGEIQLQRGDIAKADFYFQSALDRDDHCSGALNGLAEIRFHEGDLEGSRALLAKSHLASKAAATLNAVGIDLVKKERFEDALDHYTKAQYVLPQQEKGPLLFYNIGLCYSRWGKPESAMEFLRIALVKEPDYPKARRLLDQLALSQSS